MTFMQEYESRTVRPMWSVQETLALLAQDLGNLSVVGMGCQCGTDVPVLIVRPPEMVVVPWEVK